MILAKDFFNEILDRLGWPQIDSIENPSLSTRHRKVLVIGNRAIKTMGNYNDWPMLRTAGTLVLVASEVSDTSTVGTEQYVTLTQNSDIVTVANKTFTDTYIGRAIQFMGSNYVFQVIAVPASNQLQLHRAWIDDSVDTTDKVTFTIATDQYTLPDDYDRFSDKANSAFLPLVVNPIDAREFAIERRKDPGIFLGEPTIFTVWGVNTNETHQLVHFHPYPRDARMITFDYQRVHPTITSNQDKILYPDSAVQILQDAIMEIVDGDLEADENKVARVLDRMMRGYNMQQSHLGPASNKVILRPANQIRVDFRRLNPIIKINWNDRFDSAEEPLP